jgi:predicted phosphodiesterase
MRRRNLFVLVLTLAASNVIADDFKFPLKANSVRFAAIGDMGTGEAPQYAVAERMVAVRQQFPFEFVIMLGDNLYGGSKPKDYETKFELPYKPLLDAGVKFYASLGNHDNPNERFYKLFNMNGQNYFTIKKGNVHFFVLDSNYMDPKQLDWIETQLRTSKSPWKIAYFHHPLYSSGATHGPSVDLRRVIEPLFIRYGVNVVFSGHEHFYERLKPQNGIHYFISGSAGQLRRGDIRPSNVDAVGFDKDNSFMLIEIAGDKLYFQTISRTGESVDSGVIERSKSK